MNVKNYLATLLGDAGSIASIVGLYRQYMSEKDNQGFEEFCLALQRKNKNEIIKEVQDNYSLLLEVKKLLEENLPSVSKQQLDTSLFNDLIADLNEKAEFIQNQEKLNAEEKKNIWTAFSTSPQFTRWLSEVHFIRIPPVEPFDFDSEYFEQINVKPTPQLQYRYMDWRVSAEIKDLIDQYEINHKSYFDLSQHFDELILPCTTITQISIRAGGWHSFYDGLLQYIDNGHKEDDIRIAPESIEKDKEDYRQLASIFEKYNIKEYLIGNLRENREYREDIEATVKGLNILYRTITELESEILAKRKMLDIRYGVGP